MASRLMSIHLWSSYSTLLSNNSCDSLLGLLYFTGNVVLQCSPFDEYIFVDYLFQFSDQYSLDILNLSILYFRNNVYLSAHCLLVSPYDDFEFLLSIKILV